MKRLRSLRRNNFHLVLALFIAMPTLLAADGKIAQEEAGPELLPPKLDDTRSEAVDAPLIKEPALPLRHEIQLMQQIEPGFLPKDERAVKLFMLQQDVANNERILRNKREEIESSRTILVQKFKDNLNKYTQERIKDNEVDRSDATDDLIKYYEQALKNNPHHPQFAADALYNLGRYYFEVDERDYFERLNAYTEAHDQGRQDVPYPEENFSRTINLYERLIKEYPNYRQLDSVYYLLALSLWYEGAFRDAVDYFKDLIKKYPQSPYVEEVWFRLGEYFYDMQQYDNAIDAYGHVVKNSQSPFYDKAVYKTAWSQYQKDNYPQAIEQFIKVINLSEEEKGETAAASTRLEAIQYVVKSFSEELRLEDERSGLLLKNRNHTSSRGKDASVKKAALVNIEEEYAQDLGEKLARRIIAYFESIGQPHYFRDVLLEAASQLLNEQKIQGAILAFRHVIKLDPYHKDVPRLESQIIEILHDANKEEEARAASLDLIDRYSKRSEWSKAVHDIQALANAREAVRDAMLSLAIYYHKMGKAFKEANDIKRADENFEKAAQMYLAYVREYPERDDTHKAIFYFAEASYELDRYKKALEAYQLLKEYPLPMPDNIRRDATFNIVFTYRYVLENEAKEGRFKAIDFDALTAKFRGKNPEEIPEIGRQYLASIDDFLGLAPADPQVPILLYHAAAIYYVYGHIEEAESRFFHIIDNYPASQAAVASARLILDDAIAQENWPRVAEFSARFKEKNLGGQQIEFGRMEGNARFKVARAMFEEANDLQKKNQLALAKEKYIESAQLFSILLAENPQNPYADIMLWNSARAVMQSGTLTEALPLFKKLYTSFPKSEYAKAARFQEALALEKMLKFSEAARAYDGIIKEDPRSSAAADAMLNKALLYEAAGEDVLAIAAFAAFAKEYPDRSEAPEALLTAAGLYKKQGNTSEQIAMLERFIKQYRQVPSKIPNVIEAHVHVAQTYGELARASTVAAQKQRYHKAETENYRSALALYRQELNSPLAAFYAAQAQLFLQKSEQNSFKLMKITGRTGKEQGEELTAMMKKLASLQAKNEAVIKTFAQPVWNAEALYRIGTLYEHLAHAMLKAPCPRDIAKIDEFACDEYIVLLEEKAAVLEDKALTTLTQAYEIGMAAYDTPPSLIDNIQSALNRLRPGKYQRVGNVIEKAQSGAFYGEGRMLSTGKMASELHADEEDPDVKKAKPPIKIPIVEPEKALPGTEEGAGVNNDKKKLEKKSEGAE